MATLKTDIRAGQSGNVRERVEGQKVTGDVKTFFATYTTTGAEAASDELEIVGLPVGAILLVDTLRVSTDGVGGTTATLATLGDKADPDRYSATAVGITNAASFSTVTGVNANAVAPYAVTASTNVVTATLGLASGSFTAGKKVAIRGSFRMP